MTKVLRRRGHRGSGSESCTPLSHTQPVSCLAPTGHHVVLVSSGAIGVGCQRLGLTVRPTKIAQKQALAAVGQVHLMRYYEDFLQALGLVGGRGGRARARRPH